MKHIVIVEDEVFMREELNDMLCKAGYKVDMVNSFENVTEQLLSSLRPHFAGLESSLCQWLSDLQGDKAKKCNSCTCLTSRDQMKDELHALKLGADEYLTKPCRKERLLARVANVLKRYEGRANLLEGADFLLDRQTYTLYIHNQSVVLPKNQGKLLEVFLMRGDDIVTKDDLCLAIWGTTEFIDENALQVNLTRLKKTMTSLKMRQKIVSVRGVGYKLIMEENSYEAKLEDF